MMCMRLPVLAAIAVVLLLAHMPSEADDAHNLKVAERVFLEKMGQGRFDETTGIYGPGFVAHGSSGSYTLEEDNESGRAWRRAFPDLSVSIERTVASNDMIAVHWRAKGTNTAVAAGMPGRGDKADVQGMTFFRFAKGLIVEEWSLIDVATLMTQMGQ
jgi:steroid delta-isomerase-like uncharacterized protein